MSPPNVDYFTVRALDELAKLRCFIISLVVVDSTHPTPTPCTRARMHADRQRDTQTDRETDIETETETETERRAAILGRASTQKPRFL